MKKAYETDAKKAVVDFFKENKDKHFTAEEVVEALCASDVKISKSTVYRRISKLLESGEIRRFESSRADCFVYQYSDLHSGCEMHFHLKCSACGKLIHMDCDKMQEIKKHISEEHGFIIGGEAVINGICAECYKRTAG